ncbi:MAG: DUF5112 domain-containing protein [Bacteroidaceae bacterium]|nr:DUF5112 domain-containing protein [Bacteroidaceae bacterium]
MYRRMLFLLVWAVVLVSCTRYDSALPDEFNRRAYVLRYIDADSSLYYADKAYRLSDGYPDGRAEAICHKAFVLYQQMRFTRAMAELDRIDSITNNQVELLCADVLRMKITQRTGELRTFYRAWHSAERRLRRVDEEKHLLSGHLNEMLLYARTEMHIIASTYYFYSQQDSASRAELKCIEPDMMLPLDTAQWCNYMYMLGAGGMLAGDSVTVALREFDYLTHALTVAIRRKDKYFQANCLQALATLLEKPEQKRILVENHGAGIDFICGLYSHNGEKFCADSLPLTLATRSFELFRQNKDRFQTANALRTIAEILFRQHRYGEALVHLQDALQIVSEQHALDDKRVPYWEIAIFERLSLTYSALGNHRAAMEFRSRYLSLLETMRQDREEEARAEELQQYSYRLYINLAVIVILVFIVLVVFRMLHAKVRRHGMKQDREAEETLQLAKDETCAREMELAREKLSNIERRAKVSLVENVVPYINRMLNTDDMEYVAELSAEILRMNDILTEWIQVRPGKVAMNISTFSLQPLLDTIARNRSTYLQKGLSFEVPSVGDVSVKADRALTLFMINTLCDNARKFTPSGGTVSICVQADDTAVEISVRDTGIGISPENVDKINNSKVFRIAPSADENTLSPGEGGGFGFGLMNCKGIIGQMKKLSNRFQCCDFGVESTEGKGSRFWFRLPRVLSVLFFLVFGAGAFAGSGYDAAVLHYEKLTEANANADYTQAREYGRMALQAVPADSLYLRMQIENQMAIASQGLCLWDDYKRHNIQSLRLYRRITADPNLPAYAQRLHTVKTEITWSMFFSLLLLLCSVFFLVLVARRSRRRRNEVLHQKDTYIRQLETLNRVQYELDRVHIQNRILDNCLSAIKHETMYYPARIRQMALDKESDKETLFQLVHYYNDVLTILLEQARRQTQNRLAMDGSVLAELKRRVMSAISNAPVSVSVSEHGNIQEIRIKVVGGEIADNLFTPEAGNLDAFVAREIIRMHDAACGFPGLRLYVENNEIIITLWKNSRLLSSKTFSWN